MASLIVLGAQSQNQSHEFDWLIGRSEMLRMSNADSSIDYARRAVSMAQASGDAQQVVQSEFALGSAYYSRNDYELSLHHLNKSLLLARSSNDDKWTALNLGRIGNVYQLKSNYEMALSAYREAATINKRIDNKPQLARMLVNIGTVYSITGSSTKAIELMLEALGTFENIGDQEGQAWASLSISRLFNRIGNTDKAQHYAELALNKYKAINNQNGITLTLTELSNIYFRSQIYDKALSIAKQVLAINRESGNIHGQSVNHLLMGIIYYKMDSLALSLESLNKAKELKQMLNDSIDLARLNHYLGNVYIAKGRSAAGLESLNVALQIAQRQGQLGEESEIYHSLSVLHRQNGSYKLALENFQKYASLKDSLNANEIDRLEMQYDFDKREREQELITQQKEEIQRVNIRRQQTLIIFISVALLLALAFATVIFHFFKEKQRNNQILTERNAEIERQKLEIEAQRDLASHQRDQIATQQQQITDSITYAGRIQKAILPRPENLEQLLKNHFVFYLPKNIVSGDFYWVAPIADGRLAIVVADCTGHGVPGAFMSMLGITLLKELTTSVNETPGEILFRLRRLVISLLQQSGNLGDSQDGIDMALALVDREKSEIQFAGAYLPMLIVRQEKLQPISIANSVETKNGYSLFEIKGDKMPIGFHVVGEKPFTTKTIQYFSTDTFYLLSDGYTDQFGGAKNSKYMLISLKMLLLEIQHLPLNQQRERLIDNFTQYKGEQKQMDDVVLFGFKLDGRD